MSFHTCIIVKYIRVGNDFMYIQFLYNMIKCFEIYMLITVLKIQ